MTKFNLNKKNFYVKKLGAARLNKVNNKIIYNKFNVNIVLNKFNVNIVLNKNKVYVLNINLCIKYLKPIPYIRFDNILQCKKFFLNRNSSFLFQSLTAPSFFT